MLQRWPRTITQWLVLIFVISTVNGYNVEIKGRSSVVDGSKINFNATLYDDGKVAKNANYMFKWNDDASPSHSAEFTTRNPYSNWSVEYPRNKTKLGKYRVTVTVMKDYVFWIEVTNNHMDFDITDTLGGDMILKQDDVQRTNEFVSTRKPVNHTIELPDNELEYLNEHATSIKTYWFRNCTYLGVSNQLSYEAVYAESNQYYDIEALIVASFDQLPEPTTSTTTTTTSTTTTTTTTTTSTTSTTTTTTPKPTTTTTSTTPPTTTTTTTTTTTKPLPATNTTTLHRRRRASSPDDMTISLNNTVQANSALLGLNLTASLRGQSQLQQQQQQQSSFEHSSIIINPKMNYMPSPVEEITQLMHDKMPTSITLPYDCVNKSVVTRDPMKLYGYYKHRIISRSPVSNFSVNGKNWLQYGDMVDLNIKCTGSPSLQFCLRVYDAPYNATGNETCQYYSPLEECEIKFSRFFGDSKTILFFIKNDVSKMVNQVTVNIYEAKKQSQLSVVVVPITFTLVAVILVIFGVSYYIQSRNRFTVEVADFNFGETQSVDMEYKTFQQRLIDSVRDAWPRWPHRFGGDIDPDNDNDGHGASGPGNADSDIRYNAMI